MFYDLENKIAKVHGMMKVWIYIAGISTVCLLYLTFALNHYQTQSYDYLAFRGFIESQNANIYKSEELDSVLKESNNITELYVSYVTYRVSTEINYPKMTGEEALKYYSEHSVDIHLIRNSTLYRNIEAWLIGDLRECVEYSSVDYWYLETQFQKVVSDIKASSNVQWDESLIFSQRIIVYSTRTLIFVWVFQLLLCMILLYLYHKFYLLWKSNKNVKLKSKNAVPNDSKDTDRVKCKKSKHK